MRSACWLLLVVACGGGGSGTADDAAGASMETACNGIDDNGNNLVDEGCPCTPFEVDAPGTISHPLSTGDGFAALIEGDAVTSQARIHGDGTVDVLSTLNDGTSALGFAWNGTELAYVAGSSTDTYLGFIKPDGSGFHAGPGRGETIFASSGAVRFTGAGYDVLFAKPSQSQIPSVVFAKADASGTWGTTQPSQLPSATAARALTSLGDATIAVWMQHAGPGTGDLVMLGPPWMGASAGRESDPRVASNGSVVAVANYLLYRYDGMQATMVPLAQGNVAKAVAWGGRSWFVVELSAGGTELVLEELTESFEPIATTSLGTVTGGNPTVWAVADAQRLLVTYSDTTAHRAIQQCF